MLGIYNTLSLYSEVIDFKDMDHLSSLVTDDFFFDLSDLGSPNIEGAEQARQAWAAFANPYGHVVANPRIVEYDGKSATVRSRNVAVMHGGLTDVAHFVDEMVKTSAGWRIKRRKIEMITRGAMNDFLASQNAKAATAPDA